MDNPFFKGVRAAKAGNQAQIEAQLAAGKAVPGAKPGLVQGGVMGGMLKTLGIDASAIDETAERVVSAVEDLNTRLTRMEAQQAEMLTQLVAIDARSQSIESMLKDVLGRTADGAL